MQHCIIVCFLNEYPNKNLILRTKYVLIYNFFWFRNSKMYGLININLNLPCNQYRWILLIRIGTKI